MICLAWWEFAVLILIIVFLAADLATFVRRTNRLRRFLRKLVKEDESTKEKQAEIGRDGDSRV